MLNEKMIITGSNVV